MKRMKLKRTGILSFLLAVLMTISVFPMTGIAVALDKEPTGALLEEETSVYDSEILGEDINARTENSKRFLLRNGSYSVVMYEVPVHYEKNGEWVDIDNSLKEIKADEEIVITEPEQQSETSTQPIDPPISDTDATIEGQSLDDVSDIVTESATAHEKVSLPQESVQLQPKRQTRTVQRRVLRTRSNEQPVHFALEASDDHLVTIGDHQNAISWGYRGMSRSEAQVVEPKEQLKGNDRFTALQNLNGEAYYKGVYKNVDMQAIATPIGIKENLILKKKTAQTSFTLEYELNGLKAEQSGEQSIYLKDENDKIIYTITAPCMTDAKGEASADVKLIIVSQENDQLAAELSVDENWIKERGRKFPVVVDPYVILKRDWDNVDSCYIASGTPNTSYGRGGTSYEGSMYVGRHTDRGKKRALIKINNLPELNKGDIVVGAYMAFYQVRDDATMQVNVHEATKAWKQSTATWNSNITYNSAIADYLSVKPGQGYQKTWDITDLVTCWYNGKANNGMLLRSPAEDGSIVMQSWYLSGSYPENQSVRPLFQFYFRNNKGLESYWDYTSMDVGDAGTAHINNYTGNLVFSRTDAATAGLKSPITLSRIFNGYMAGERFGDAKNPGPIPRVGSGWKLNIQQTISPSTAFGLSGDQAKQFPYAYTDGDGTIHYFMKTSSGTLEDEDGLKLKLTDNGTGNAKYKITDDDKTIMEFDTSGNLRRIVDINGNEIKLNYKANSNMIQSVTDGGGNIIRLEEHTNGGGYMPWIHDPAGRSTYFFYDASYLTYIKEPDGTRINYTYDSYGRMTSAQASDGYKIVFSYSSIASGSKVTGIQEYAPDGTAGQKITLDYSKAYTTTIRDSGSDGIFGNADDVRTTYQFDSFGRTTGIYSKTDNQELGAAGYQYTAGSPNSTGSNIRQLNRLSQEYSIGSTPINLMRNHSFELAAHWGTAAWNGNATFTATMSTDQKYFGAKSMKINVTTHDSDAAGRVYEDLTLTPGKTYTVSGYVKTSNITSSRTSGVGAVIFTDSFNADGGFTKTYTEYLTGTTDTTIDNGWRRISSTFTVPANCTKVRINLAVRGAKGTAWFDGLQVEEGSVSSPYNMLENADFEEDPNDTHIPRGWTGSGLVNGFVDGTVTTKYTGSHSYRIIGDPAKQKFIQQEVNVGGTEDDVYIASAWAKAGAVPLDNGGTRKFRILIKITYTDGSVNWKTESHFNYSITDWQYTSVAFNLGTDTTTRKTPKSVSVILQYYHQGNTAFFDNVMLVKDATQSYTYDNDGKLISTVDNANNLSKMEYTNGNLTKSIDAKGYSYTYDYDSKNNMTKATSQTGMTHNYKYNSNGLSTEYEVKSKANDVAIKTHLEHTDSGNFVSKTYNSDGQLSEHFAYDEKTGNLQSVSDINGRTVHEYDENGNLLLKVTRHRNDSSVTIGNVYSYDASQRLSKIVNGDSTYAFAYDKFGNSIKTTVGNRTISEQVYKANNGPLQKSAFGNGFSESYVYDEFGNIKSKLYNEELAFTYISDRRGAIVKKIDHINNRQTESVVDSTGRLSQFHINAANRRILSASYGYDKNNNIDKINVLAGVHSMTDIYTYGKDNLPEKFEHTSGKKLEYKYDGLNRLEKKTINTNQPLTWDYTFLSSMRNEDGSDQYTTNLIASENTPFGSFNYTYDDVGNITNIIGNGEVSYQYDTLNQLTGDSNTRTGIRNTYGYDNSGNMLQRQTFTDGQPGYQEFEYRYEDASWPDMLTSFNGEQIQYDEIGNPTFYRQYSMSWEGKKLMGIDNLSTYSYDDNGIRVSKTHNYNTSNYEYLNGKLIMEQRANVTMYFSYDALGNPFAISRYFSDGRQDVYYYACNMFGDVIALYDAEGDIAASYEYDVWGNLVSMEGQTGADAIQIMNPLRYRGYYYDSEVNLYYLEFRYYDPETGRFISADGIIDTSKVLGLNMFSYCNNNPVMSMDPSGYIQIPNKAAYDSMMLARAQIAILNGAKQAVKIAKTPNPLKQNFVSKIDPKYPPNKQPDPKDNNHNYKEPKKHKGPLKPVKDPTSNKKGFPDENGDPWVFNPKQHGGEGWTIPSDKHPQGHYHGYPGGKMRYHDIKLQPVHTDNSLKVAGIAMLIGAGALGVLFLPAGLVAGGAIITMFPAAEQGFRTVFA